MTWPGDRCRLVGDVTKRRVFALIPDLTAGMPRGRGADSAAPLPLTRAHDEDGEPYQRAASAVSRTTASLRTSSRLQNAKRTRVRAAALSSQKTATGTPTTPHNVGI